MSLLTQFYPGPGGSSTVVLPGGVPSMSVGGITNNVVSQAYYAGGAPFYTFPAPSINPTAGGSTAGFYTGGTRGRTWWVQSTANIAPIANTANVVTGYYLGATYDSTWTNYGSPPPALVFENVATIPQATWTLANIGSIYGPTLRSPVACTITADSHLTTWGYGMFTSNFNFTLTAPGLTDVSTCIFSVTNSAVTFNFSGCPLNTASVDKILTDNASFIDPAWGWTGTINLGGSCSPPSAAGLAAKTALQSAGLTILTN